MKYTNIVIIGGAGFIGSNFVRYINEKYPKIKITIVDKLTYASTIETIEDLLENKGMVNTQIKRVDCGPGKTTGIGTRTWCEVSWEYKGLPGSSLSLLPNGYGTQQTKMTSESEVVIK